MDSAGVAFLALVAAFLALDLIAWRWGADTRVGRDWQWGDDDSGLSAPGATSRRDEEGLQVHQARRK